MNANVNYLLRARAGDHGSVLLSVLHTSSRINFIGASCPASVGPITHGLTSLTVAPQPGKNGIVAIQVWHQPIGEKHANRDLCFLLPTTYKERPFVDLVYPFIPVADHLAQLTDNGLLVTVGDQKFVAPNFCSETASGLVEAKALWAEQKIRIVPDANFLCRFLVGDATLEEVVAAVKVRQAAQDLPAKYAGLESLNKELEQALKKLEAKRYATASIAINISGRAMELQRIAEDIIGNAQKAKFGNRQEVLERIADYKDSAQDSRLNLIRLISSLSPEKTGK